MEESQSLRSRVSNDVETQRQRIEELRRQRDYLREELRARSANANELRQRMKDRDQAKANEMKTRMNGTTLAANLQNTYGQEALDRATAYYNPPTGKTAEYKKKSTMLVDLMEQRKMDQRLRETQYQEQLKILNDHRRNLMHEQQRLHEEKRQLIGGWHTPSVDSIPGDHDPLKYPRPEYPLDTPTEPPQSPYYPYPENPIETMEIIVDRAKKAIPRLTKDIESLKKFMRKEEREMRSILKERQHPDEQRLQEEDYKQVQRELEKEREREQLWYVSELIRDGILLNVTEEITGEVAAEHFELRRLANAKANNMIIRSCEVAASASGEERLPQEPGYDQVNKLYDKYQTARFKKKMNDRNEKLWKHGMPVTTVAVEKGMVEIDDGIEPIFIDKIPPINVRNKETSSIVYQNFREREAMYWQQIGPSHSEIQVRPNWKGIQSGSLSGKHRFLALGTVRGDVLVYDLFVTPPLLLYVKANYSKRDETLESIVWSPDDTQLVGQRERSLTVWNLSDSLEVNEKEVADLQIKIDKNSFFKPFSLKEVIHLTQSRGDFLIKSGPLADRGGEKVTYDLGACAFHPSSTLGGTNLALMVSLESGDVQKLDLEPYTFGEGEEDLKYSRTRKAVYNDVVKEGEPNLIGGGIEVEIFKAHEAALMHMGFVSGSGDMITLDELGYLNWWKYGKDYFSDTFEPYKRNKLKLQIVDYVPSNNEPPQEMFSLYRTDEKKKRRVLRSDEEIEDLRDEMEKRLFYENVEEKDPLWSTYDDTKDQLTELYNLEAISRTGSYYYTITRRKQTGALMKVEKQLLRPVLTRAKRILEVERTPDGDVLVYMLVFPPNDPLLPRVSFFAYDLEAKENVDLRLDIEITQQEYDLCLRADVCSFKITRPFEATSTAYVISNIVGSIQGFSLTTGSCVMKFERNPFVGLNLAEYTELPRSFINLPSTSHILVASTPKTGEVRLISFGPDQLTVDFLTLVDNNTEEDRRATWLAYRTLEMQTPEKIIAYDPDQRLRRILWTLDNEEYVSAETACRTVVLDLVDDAVDIAFFERAMDQEPEPQFDQSGQQVVDENGMPVLVTPKRGYPENYDYEKQLRMDGNRQDAFKTKMFKNFYGDQKNYSSFEEMGKASEKFARKMKKAKADRLAAKNSDTIE